MLRLCGFIKKHGKSKNLAAQQLVQEYCTGQRQDECKRKEYMVEHGKVPSDDMLPSGQTAASS